MLRPSPAVLLALLPLAGCLRPSPATAPLVRLVKLPDAGAAVPDAVMDKAGSLHVVYGMGNDVWYRVTPDLGAAWSLPVRVNDAPGAADAPGLFRGPALAIGKARRLHVVWFPARGGAAAGPRGAHLDPGGLGFSPSVTLATVSGTEPVDGLAVAADPDGRVAASWVTTGALVVARSEDNGATFVPPERVAGTDPVLTCATRGLFTLGGGFLVLYRDIAGKDRREAVAAWPALGGGPVRRFVATSAWPVDACPTTGGWLAPAGAGAVAAWESGETVVWARLGASGAPGAPGEIATGAVDGRWPVVAANADGAVLVAWKENATLRWRLYDAAGDPEGPAAASPAAGPDRPGIAVAADGTFLLVDALP